ncbi:cyclin-dependent kinase 4 [Corythoichthys intestinalis]|uniref:cyclin-dependent kinase 4 n=1 Tax=Corythoichthys intestinalis TaxID=161448 RepID=UPI0025A5A147|nr:cyclin-dependent kinase 4 [Corythoichthys intestinalis]XP_057682350.1 cyclin-dependent kinase 4 [Corythoichthys intestinalis]XP_057682351.1 cyclin-dependent kinase 4 [Corythoichthys intestinalis]XP_057682353.1 cyclin-dependent kinase 4 [Corythoichthys intestinalis]
MEPCESAFKYELLTEIGQGAYSQVYLAREEGVRGRFLAVKKFHFCSNSALGGAPGVPPFVLREVALLLKLRFFEHVNIVKLLDVTAMLANMTLDLTVVLEYIQQDLYTYLSRAPPSGLQPDNIKSVIMQVLRGLDFMHVNMVVHRDLKPDNILISSGGIVKIADFGLARLYSFNMALTPGVVTLWYRAPEVLLNSVYLSSVDVWSAGCIFAELFQLKPLFGGFTEAQQLKMIFEFIGLPGDDEWPPNSPISYSLSLGPKDPHHPLLSSLNPKERDLLLQCLTFTPSRRISAAGALAHPFFSCH